jgi:hypothetical protein
MPDHGMSHDVMPDDGSFDRGARGRETEESADSRSEDAMKAKPADADNDLYECVEIYVPKKLEHLSELFLFLRKKLSERQQGIPQAVPIDGFSMYEVDGAFYSEQFFQERTIVIRILFKRAASEDAQSIREKIRTLGAEIASTVAITEEEFWICHYPQGVVIFRADNHENRHV